MSDHFIGGRQAGGECVCGNASATEGTSRGWILDGTLLSGRP